jgi:hypothetical protein
MENNVTVLKYHIIKFRDWYVGYNSYGSYAHNLHKVLDSASRFTEVYEAEKVIAQLGLDKKEIEIVVVKIETITTYETIF